MTSKTQVNELQIKKDFLEKIQEKINSYSMKRSSHFTQTSLQSSPLRKQNQKLNKFLFTTPDVNSILKDYKNIQNFYLNEISHVENFNERYMTDALENFDKKKVKINIITKKKKLGNLIKKKNSENNDINSEEFYLIKRNDYPLDEREIIYTDFQNDSSINSLTEIKLNELYRESIEIQKNIINTKNELPIVGKRLKQFLRLNALSKFLN